MVVVNIGVLGGINQPDPTHRSHLDASSRMARQAADRVRTLPTSSPGAIRTPMTEHEAATRVQAVVVGQQVRRQVNGNEQYTLATEEEEPNGWYVACCVICAIIIVFGVAAPLLIPLPGLSY